MLFKILLCVLTVYVCISPYFYAKAVKFGMKISQKPEEAAEEPVFHVPEKRKKPEMTPEQKRWAQISENMERYDGTANGQKEIKHNE